MPFIGTLGLVLVTLFSHWRHHPVQGLAWLSGLLLATALWSGVQALNAQARDSYDRAASLFDGAALPSLVAREGSLLAQTDYSALRRQGWPVSPVLEGRLQFPRTEADPLRLTLVGIDPLTLPAEATAGQALDGTGSDLIAFLTNPGRTLVSPDSLRALEASPGDQVSTTEGQVLPPLAVNAAIPPGSLLVDIGFAQRLLSQEGQVSRLLIPDDPRWLDKPLPSGVADRLRWQAGQSEDDLGRLTDSFHLNLTALGLLAFVVGLFIVHGSTGLAFEQRRGLLRTLRACGVSQRMVLVGLLTELLLLALVAGLLGLALGYLVAGWLLPDVAASLQGLYGARVSDQLHLDPQWWFAGLGMALGGALLASLSSLWQAARMPVLVLARSEAWGRRQSGLLRLQARVGLALLAGAGLILTIGSGLVLAFAGLAALLLGAALCLPMVLSLCLRLGQRFARGPLSEWFWAETRQQLSGLSLALMALLLALAANVGVGGMVDSFRLTFTGWLDQRLAAEAYLNADSPQQAERIDNWLQQQPEVDAVLPTVRATVRYGDWPLEINGIRPHATYEDHWPVLDLRPGAWFNLAAGQGALVSEQWVRTHGSGPGDEVTLTGDRDWTLTIEGVYADYGNPRPQMLVSGSALTDWYTGTLHQGFSLRLPPEQASGLVARARDELSLSDFAAIDQASVRRFSEQVFERTFVATGALNTLTLGVAAIALFTSLLTLSHSRLPQLAPLWAQGVTRRQLAWLEGARTLGLALLTVLLAIPLGLLLAWILVAVINVEAFGWRLPLYFFPLQWLTLAGLGLISALLATVWPAWRLGRQSAGSWTKVFATEGGA